MAMQSSPLGGQLWKSGSQAPSTIGGKTFTPAAWYPSSRDPKNGYTVCEVSDGTVSCDCPGWTKRNPPGGRTCKHSKDYIQYLRPLWGAGAGSTAAPEPVAAAVGTSVQSGAKEKGGSLADLFKKLEESGL